MAQSASTADERSSGVPTSSIRPESRTRGLLSAAHLSGTLDACPSRLQQVTQVVAQVSGPAVGSGPHQVGRAVGSGQHQHAVQPGGHGARDVGVQPVSDEDRVAGSEPGDRGVDQWAVRLAGDLRIDLHRESYGSDGGTVARHDPPVGRPGGVDVGGHPVRAPVDRDRRLVELVPGQVEAEALQHGDRLVVGRADPDQTHLREGVPDAGAPDGEHLGARTETMGDQLRTGLGGRDHVVLGRLDAELAEVLGDRGGRPGGVVGDEADPGAPIPQRTQTLRRPVDGHRAQVHHAVEIEQGGVVAVSERAHRRVSSVP